jgi:hypothetical protein
MNISCLNFTWAIQDKRDVGALSGAFGYPKDSEKQMNSTVKNHSKLWSLAGSFIICVILPAASPVAVGAAMVSDFALTDVNSTSSTYNQSVSPRDYLEQVSGWYFGYAT